MPAYASIFVNIFFRIPAKVDSEFSRDFWFSPPPFCDLHPEDTLEVDTVPFGCCIVGVARMMFGFLRKTKRKMMVVEEFVLFFPVAPELNGGSYTIAVIGDRRLEQILMRCCLMVI